MSGPAAPFSLGEGDDACLLLHGLTGAPAEVRPVGEALARAGFRAVGPLLPGHGTSPQDLEAVTRSDMLDAARVSALALLAPAVEMAGLTWVFTQVLGRLPAFPGVIGKGARDIQALSGVPPPDDRVPEGDPAPRTAVAEDGSYTAVPWRWGRELRLLSEEAMAVAGRVRARALILHGGRDRTASLRGARRLSRSLSGSAPGRVFPRSGHVLPLDVDGPAVCDAIVSFFQEG